MKKAGLSIISLFFLLSLMAVDLPRVALIPLDDEARKVADLTLAQPLTGSVQPGWVFLERAEIEKISRELKLSASALSREDFSLGPGLLENTDVFGVVAFSEGELLFIAFDAKTGIRLINTDVYEKNVEGRAEKINSLLAAAVIKRPLLDGKNVWKFGFIPLVTANLPMEHADFALKAERILIREIGSRTDAVVLERRYLGALLKEPDAEKKQLTREILASSLLVRLTASPGKDGKIRLVSEFIASGGKQTLAQAEYQLDPKGELRAQVREFIGSQKFDFSKGGTDKLRNQEASNFIAQAYFALQHSFQKDAVASAETAATLDKKQELALCEIYASTCRNALGNWHGAPKDKIPEVVKNFQNAVRIARKYNIFPSSLLRFIEEWGYVSPHAFKSLPPETQKEMRGACDEYFAARHESLKPLLERAGQGGNSVVRKLAALSARGEYIHTMGQESDQYWNYEYLGRYVQPQLEIFNREVRELLPELEKFFATPSEQRPKRYPIAKGKENASDRSRNGSFLGSINILERSGTGDFHNRNFADISEADREILRKFLEMMEDSPLMAISVRGLRGLRRLEKKTTGNWNKDAEINRELYDGFALKMQECFRTKTLLGDYALDGGYFSLTYDVDFLNFPARLVLWETAIERYHYYHIFRYMLIQDFEKKLSFEETRMLYETVKKNFERWRNDPLARGEKKTYIADEFKAHLETLEKKYPQLNPDRVSLPKTPFSQVIMPFAALKEQFHPMGCAIDNGTIYTAALLNNLVRLVKIDARNDFAVTLGENFEKIPDCRGRMAGFLLDDYYVVWNWDYVLLCPRDGSKPEVVSFKEYYEGDNTCVAGCGDRIFLSYGKAAGYQKPGTLLEYNVKTGEKKVLVSTLDKTVKWPLQGVMNWPYHILTLTADVKRRRVLTVLHTGAFRMGFNAPPMKVYAYYWDTEKWEALSDEVPIFHGDEARIFVEGDEILLMDTWPWSNKCGTIRPDGSWRLEMQVIDCKLDTREKKYSDNRRFRMDYSHIIMPPGIKDGEVNARFFCRSDGILLGNEVLFIPREKLFYRFTEQIDPRTFFDGKYVVEWSGYKKGGESFRIGILKNISQMKNEMEKASHPAEPGN